MASALDLGLGLTSRAVLSNQIWQPSHGWSGGVAIDIALDAEVASTIYQADLGDSSGDPAGSASALGASDDTEFVGTWFNTLSTTAFLATSDENSGGEGAYALDPINGTARTVGADGNSRWGFMSSDSAKYGSNNATQVVGFSYLPLATSALSKVLLAKDAKSRFFTGYSWVSEKYIYYVNNSSANMVAHTAEAEADYYWQSIILVFTDTGTANVKVYITKAGDTLDTASRASGGNLEIDGQPFSDGSDGYDENESWMINTYTFGTSGLGSGGNYHRMVFDQGNTPDTIDLQNLHKWLTVRVEGS
jgi:hypothetical protein